MSFLLLEERLQDFGKNSSNETFAFTSEELVALGEVQAALSIVEICSKRLSSEGATVRSADIAMQVSFRFDEFIWSALVATCIPINPTLHLSS